MVVCQILEVCYKSGVTHVTIYAFSIENFKRSRYEVDALMEMAKIKLTQLSQHGELLDRYGARIRILGQRSLLKKDVLEAMDRAVKMTEHNHDTVLNVCFPYTSRDEMTSGVRGVVEEWCRPVKSIEVDNGHRRRAFAEDRIRRNVQRQEQLERTEHGDMESMEPRIHAEQRHVQEHADSTSPDNTPNEYHHIPNTYESYNLNHNENEHEHDNDDNDNETSSPLSPSSSTTTLPQDLPSPITPSSPLTSYHSSPKSTTLHLIPQSNSLPSPESITATTITTHLFAPHDPPLDLLIRTSGVARLSDFMLWQCHEYTRIVFLDVLWPEFDLWSFLPVLWEWQFRARKEEGFALALGG